MTEEKKKYFDVNNFRKRLAQEKEDENTANQKQRVKFDKAKIQSGEQKFVNVIDEDDSLRPILTAQIYGGIPRTTAGVSLEKTLEFIDNNTNKKANNKFVSRTKSDDKFSDNNSENNDSPPDEKSKFINLFFDEGHACMGGYMDAIYCVNIVDKILLLFLLDIYERAADNSMRRIANEKLNLSEGDEGYIENEKGDLWEFGLDDIHLAITSDHGRMFETTASAMDFAAFEHRNPMFVTRVGGIDGDSDEERRVIEEGERVLAERLINENAMQASEENTDAADKENILITTLNELSYKTDLRTMHKEFIDIANAGPDAFVSGHNMYDMMHFLLTDGVSSKTNRNYKPNYVQKYIKHLQLSKIEREKKSPIERILEVKEYTAIFDGKWRYKGKFTRSENGEHLLNWEDEMNNSYKDMEIRQENKMVFVTSKEFRTEFKVVFDSEFGHIEHLIFGKVRWLNLAKFTHNESTSTITTTTTTTTETASSLLGSISSFISGGSVDSGDSTGKDKTSDAKVNTSTEVGESSEKLNKSLARSKQANAELQNLNTQPLNFAVLYAPENILESNLKRMENEKIDAVLTSAESGKSLVIPPPMKIDLAKIAENVDKLKQQSAKNADTPAVYNFIREDPDLVPQEWKMASIQGYKWDRRTEELICQNLRWRLNDRSMNMHPEICDLHVPEKCRILHTSGPIKTSISGIGEGDQFKIIHATISFGDDDTNFNEPFIADPAYNETSIRRQLQWAGSSLFGPKAFPNLGIAVFNDRTDPRQTYFLKDSQGKDLNMAPLVSMKEGSQGKTRADGFTNFRRIPRGPSSVFTFKVVITFIHDEYLLIDEIYELSIYGKYEACYKDFVMQYEMNKYGFHPQYCKCHAVALGLSNDFPRRNIFEQWRREKSYAFVERANEIERSGRMMSR